METLVIGIAGGPGFGKTTVAKSVINAIGNKKVVYIQQGSYYKDRSNISLEERENINYDHPDALENDLLVYHLQELCNGHLVRIPIYDFKAHTRKPETVIVNPKKLIIVEGILVITVFIDGLKPKSIKNMLFLIHFFTRGG